MHSPIRPEEHASAKAAALPDFVFEAINMLLAQKLDFTQVEAANAILSKAPEGVTRDELYDKHYMDFEGAYRAAGWVVVYDSPSYYESYAAYYTFKKPSKSGA